MEITWSISQLDRTLPDGCVTTIHWTASQTDGDFTASSYGSLGVPAKDPSDPTFIAFASLTKEQVLEWVWQTVDKDAYEASLASQIEAQKNPISATGVPW